MIGKVCFRILVLIIRCSLKCLYRNWEKGNLLSVCGSREPCFHLPGLSGGFRGASHELRSCLTGFPGGFPGRLPMRVDFVD